MGVRIASAAWIRLPCRPLPKLSPLFREIDPVLYFAEIGREPQSERYRNPRRCAATCLDEFSYFNSSREVPRTYYCW
jgi:hypothetical protein